MEPPVSGGRVGRASHLASGFSGILYLRSSDRAGKGLGGGEGESGHAVDTGIASPSSRKRAPNSVTYCVPTYLFVVNI